MLEKTKIAWKHISRQLIAYIIKMINTTFNPVSENTTPWSVFEEELSRNSCVYVSFYITLNAYFIKWILITTHKFRTWNICYSFSRRKLFHFWFRHFFILPPASAPQIYIHFSYLCRLNNKISLRYI